MEGIAKTYIELGYVPIGISLQWNTLANKKKIGFKPMWERATLGTYKDFFNKEDNGIALLTGEPSDLIVIDCDILKLSDHTNNIQDGMIVFEDLVRQHGLPDNTPIQHSASGGKHYFFSLSKSIENGLNSAKNITKVRVNGLPTSIDTRSDRGCIIVAPSQVQQKKYNFEVPLITQAEMPAMPTWCIEILNNHSGNVSNDKVTKQDILCKQMSELSHDSNMEHRISVFLHDVKSVVEKVLGTKIAKQWTRTNGFDFKPRSIVECVLCNGTHESNNYLVRQIIENCFYMRNYSSLCPPRAFNWENHESIKMVLHAPMTDKPYSMMLNASFRSQGYLLVHAYDMKTDKGRFMCFNGHIWQEISKHRVLSDLSDTCSTILNTLLKHVSPALDADNDQVLTIKKQRIQLEKGKTYVQKSTNLNNILTFYRILYTDEVIESRLDQNPDIIVVKNGIIDLQTGELRDGLPSDYMSRQLDVKYTGLDTETDVIDKFIGDLFNYDQDSIAYLQRLLGYGITGCTDSQIWAMFTGEGSNGKSLLASLLQSLLEKWVVTAPYEIFFRGDQRAREGSHSTHLGTLRGARICIKEEAEPKDKLNVEILKTITGGSSVTMRAAYASSYETFQPIALPILLCNHRPEVDVTDAAMMRRIVVIPFHNIYTLPDDPKRPFNASNPHHRLRDSELKKKLLDEDAREQFLVWLVRGAIAWYNNKDLSKQPPVMLQAFKAYNDENDKLQQFIDMYCEKGELCFVTQSHFRDTYCKIYPSSMQPKLERPMLDKGFTTATRTIEGRRLRIYIGLTIIN